MAGLYILENNAISNYYAKNNLIAFKIGITRRKFQDRIRNLNGIYTDEEINEMGFTIKEKYGAINGSKSNNPLINLTHENWIQLDAYNCDSSFAQKNEDLVKKELTLYKPKIPFRTRIVNDPKKPSRNNTEEKCEELFTVNFNIASKVLTFSNKKPSVVISIKHNSPTTIYALQFKSERIDINRLLDVLNSNESFSSILLKYFDFKEKDYFEINDASINVFNLKSFAQALMSYISKYNLLPSFPFKNE